MAFPVFFVSHGAPSVALEEDDYTRALREWARVRPKPRAIVILSAHGEAQGPVRVNSALRPSLIYDFYGFPPALYQLSYPAPGAPDLAHEVADALEAEGLEPVLDSLRGWDHGVWVPLRLLYPRADVPVIELSLPVPRTPDLLLGLGRPLPPLRWPGGPPGRSGGVVPQLPRPAPPPPVRLRGAGRLLAPLRRRGVLLVGSGGIVHNLHRVRMGDAAAAPEEGAVSFDSLIPYPL